MAIIEFVDRNKEAKRQVEEKKEDKTSENKKKEDN